MTANSDVSHPTRPRPRPRIPSGPRSLPSSRQSTSASNLLSLIQDFGDEPTNVERWVPGGVDNGFTSSPPATSPAVSAGLINPFDQPIHSATATGLANPKLSSTQALPSKKGLRQQSTPATEFKLRPKPLKVNTTNLVLPANSSPKKAVSPSLKHWQQVRTHVLTTPVEEKDHKEKSGPNQGTWARGGIVGKAAAKFRFRQGTEDGVGSSSTSHLIPVKNSSTAILSGGELSEAEKEVIAKERRRFARDIKNCLDSCALEDSRRRLAGRNSKGRERVRDPTLPLPADLSTQPNVFHPDFSPFAPLLTELHKYLPAARARKAWCRTCPHHTTILAELSTAFLSDSMASHGERQQALEVFGVIVRSWAADGPDEGFDRWLWLCRAIRIGDRQLRNRGLTLLQSFLHKDPEIPDGGESPSSGEAFRALGAALVQLLHAVEVSEYDAETHRQIILGLLADLVEGNVIALETQGEKVGGMEKELIWLALGSIAGSIEIAEWLLAPDNPLLLRFTPPPLLHATPPDILKIRIRSATTFLNSLTTVITFLNPTMVRRIFDTMQDLVIDDLKHLPGDVIGPARALGRFMIACLSSSVLIASVNIDEDPFTKGIERALGDRTYLEASVSIYGMGEEWAKGLESALKEIIGREEMDRTLAIIQLVLSETGLKQLVSTSLQALLIRIETSTEDAHVSRNFLIQLSRSHPQLYYKSLFSLAASTTVSTTTEHLKTVRILSKTTGVEAFWLDAEPQMVAVVLMGDAKRSEGKGKENEVEVINIRIGRYAVLIEFLLALGEVKGGAKSGSRLRSFLDALEVKLGMILHIQETDAVLPSPYRALICVLFFRIRTITQSTKKAEWNRIVLRWFLDAAAADAESDRSTPLSELRDMYRGLLSTANPIAPTLPGRKSTMGTTMTISPPSTPPSHPILPLLHPKLLSTSSELLVLLQACWTLNDWTILLPYVWDLFDRSQKPLLPLLFLLQKCGEMIPSQLRSLIDADLQDDSPIIRSSAIHKLSTLYGYRYQLSSLPTLSSRRGPLFQFPHETLDFVLTEIGSSTWAAPHDVQQEALQKYGSNLPVEVRQRLMELGWSDEPGLKVEEGYLAEPISSLPIKHLLEKGLEMVEIRKGIGRQNSGGSGMENGGMGGRAQRAMFAPVLWEVAGLQALRAIGADGGTENISRGLVRMLQRDDPSLFIRPFADLLSTDLQIALSHLNAVIIRPTPAFAYTSFNVLVGYLKHILRDTPHIEGHARALTTIANLVIHVPGISLRDIRKHKAEHILLPASIHEEDGGFKVHLPWREEANSSSTSSVDIQSAQLLFIAQLLHVNPREVNIIKRMISNLQIQKSSLIDMTFARSWLDLIVTLFNLVSRTYNDRAELRHFLTTACVILRTHSSDIIIVTQTIRLFILCSARFRRLFAIMGFQTIIRPIFDTYVEGSNATKDCIEYAMSSFYRIHQDSSVYQFCLAIIISPYSSSSTNIEPDPKAVYSLLSCLAEPNNLLSGVASGIKGMNDKEEHEALIQMLSGPEIALSEIGKDRAERQAEKLAEAALVETRFFPKESIIRLFVTIIAANPPSGVGVGMLRLFSGMVEYIRDESSRRLLGDGVEALGGIISREKVDSASIGMLGDIALGGDWAGAKVGYLGMVDKWLATKGVISQACTKIVLEMITSVIHGGYTEGFKSASDILGSLTNTHLASDRPQAYHKVASTTFQLALGKMDISGVLDEFTSWIRRNDYEVDIDTARLVIDQYLEPAIKHIIHHPDETDDKLRQSTVSLLSTAVLLPAGAIDILESEPLSLQLLTYIIFPLVISFEIPLGAELEKLSSGMWIRILHLIIKPKSPRPPNQIPTADARSAALLQALSLQVIKVICIRAGDTISTIKGLWNYIAQYIIGLITPQSPLSQQDDQPGSVRLLDMVTWSLYELMVLHRTPLMIYMRYQISVKLASLDKSSITRGSSSKIPDPLLIPTIPKAEYNPNVSPSFITRNRLPSLSLRRPSTNPPAELNSSPLSKHLSRLSPSPRHPHISRLSPSLSSDSDFSYPSSSRPTFAQISQRRSSRPAIQSNPSQAMRNRFPSSAEMRKVGSGGGAIVHLLGASSGVAGLAAGRASNDGSRPRGGDMDVWDDVRINCQELRRRMDRAIRACRVFLGYKVELINGEEDEIGDWSIYDALLEISEEMRLLVEVEFRELFHVGQSQDVRETYHQEEYGEDSGGLQEIYEAEDDGIYLLMKSRNYE